ncbi:radical SAM/SPASM domain-containing protein [Magnetospira sp. QH-2]|uniref:radical SAM/SPASM domain-containing protein n=1 Tax=Magnetospira sp. (strain QH-2) TaxID=1288970 RepID=UPI0003E80C9F|nr:radical SAM/SPASM domain-containing protein [Magnetospira sp. QH-2]CCQ73074.1 conserved protein of unknown function [Magnetospira sp. QH-2]
MKINFGVKRVTSLSKELRYVARQRHPLRYLINRFRWHYYPQLFHVSRFPDHLDIETSSACQIHCPMCFLTVRKDVPKNIMSMALFERIMAEVARRDPYSIRLSWRGECLVNPRFKDMLIHARSVYNGSISFLTNGLRLTEDLIDTIIEQDVCYIVISADGLGAIYEEVRKPGKFDDLIAKLAYLKHRKEELGRYRPQVRINAVGTWFRGDELARFIETFDPYADRILVGELLSNFDSVPVEHDPSLICAQPWQRMMIAWDGKIYPCCDDYTGLYPVGDVNEQSLKEIWHGDRLNQLRDWNRKRERLKCDLCRTRDCGIDRNPHTHSDAMKTALRNQVLDQYGKDTPLLKYLE